MSGRQSDCVIGITGATGMLGRALTAYLIAQGYSVVCLVRSGSPEVAASLGLGETDLVTGDLNDAQAVRAFVARIGRCIHLAAYVGHGTAAQYDAVNVVGTRLLCETIVRDKPACRLVYCSSIAVLRIPKRLALVATDYARSKQRATEVVKGFSRTRGLDAAIVYPGLIYGPGDTRLVPALIERLAGRRMLPIRGGDRSAPLIYIADLCRLFLLAATRDVASGKEYIGVNRHAGGVRDFVRIVAERIGAKPPPAILPKSLAMTAAILLEALYRLLDATGSPPLSRRVVDILSLEFEADSAAADAELGWRPEVGAQEGIGRFFEWLAVRDDPPGWVREVRAGAASGKALVTDH